MAPRTPSMEANFVPLTNSLLNYLLGCVSIFDSNIDLSDGASTSAHLSILSPSSAADFLVPFLKNKPRFSSVLRILSSRIDLLPHLTIPLRSNPHEITSNDPTPPPANSPKPNHSCLLPYAHTPVPKHRVSSFPWSSWPCFPQISLYHPRT